MTTLTETQVRLIASPKSWIEGEAIRQLFATAKLENMTLAIGFPICIPGKARRLARLSSVKALFIHSSSVEISAAGWDCGKQTS